MMKKGINVIGAIEERLHGVLPSDGQVLLFGSRARGDHRADSDWDILILVNKDKLDSSDYDTYSYPLFELGWELDEAINPVLYTQREWERGHFTLFHKNVEHDAIRLL